MLKPITLRPLLLVCAMPEIGPGVDTRYCIHTLSRLTMRCCENPFRIDKRPSTTYCGQTERRLPRPRTFRGVPSVHDGYVGAVASSNTCCSALNTTSGTCFTPPSKDTDCTRNGQDCKCDCDLRHDSSGQTQNH